MKSKTVKFVFSISIADLKTIVEAFPSVKARLQEEETPAVTSVPKKAKKKMYRPRTASRRLTAQQHAMNWLIANRTGRRKDAVAYLESLGYSHLGASVSVDKLFKALVNNGTITRSFGYVALKSE